MRLRTQNMYTHRESIEGVVSLVEDACRCDTTYATGVTDQHCIEATLARLVDVLAERGMLTGPDIVRIVGGPHEADAEQAEVLK